MHLPSVFILGAPKCGTTYLSGLLAQLPAMVPPSVKEPNFFENDENYSRGLTAYADLFRDKHPGPPDSIHFEATPWYLYSATAADRMAAALGQAPRLIVCVREPIERAVSMYRDAAGHGEEARSFRRALSEDYEQVRSQGPGLLGRRTSYLSGGFYAEALAPWIRLFGPEAIRLVGFDELKARPRSVLDALAAWVPTPTHLGAVPTETTGTNPASGTRFPRVEITLRAAARSSVGRRVTERVPWRAYRAAGARWSRWSRSPDAAPEVAPDEVAWLRERAADLFETQPAQLATALGLSKPPNW